MSTLQKHQKEEEPSKPKVVVEELPIVFMHHNIQVTGTYLKTINSHEN